jgi:deoxycytidylate deaminase
MPEQLLPIPRRDDTRLSIEEYGCMLSLIGKGRSEDCFTHTSGVAISKDKRILGISYNGLKAGMQIPNWMKLQENRAKKSDFYLHAEDNLFSLVKRGECDLLCLNISPCISCCRTIAANNVRRVVYLKEYHRCNKFKEFLAFYDIDYAELPIISKQNIRRYLLDDRNFEELM